VRRLHQTEAWATGPVHLALADSQPADAAPEAEETEDRMTDLLTMSFVVSLCALAVILHAWDGIQASLVAWWRRRQMRIAAKHQQQLYAANNGRPVAIRTFMKMKAR
jgi:hypothetical protein